MVVDIKDVDENSFMRHWAERVWDQSQLAQMEAIQQHLITYAMTAWRPSGSIPPPTDVLLICACEEGVVLMAQNQLGEWRTSQGVPHKPPRAWMPCPAPPPLNGKGPR